MSKKFDKDDLLKIAESGLTDLSCEKIKELIEKEAAKNYEDINTDYIDLCFTALKIKQNGGSLALSEIGKNPRRKLTVRKALLFAAALIVLIAATLTVSAKVFNIPKEISQLNGDTAEIDVNLEHADTTADGYALTDTELAKKIAEFGISPITFPEEMINDNCEITKIENLTSEEAIARDALITFEYQGYTGDLVIEQYTQDLKGIGYHEVMGVISGQMLSVNGMDILIYECEAGCKIIYKDNLTEYNISLFGDIETAIQFAESIK